MTQAFTFKALHPFAALNFDTPHFQLLECFTVILYDKTSEFQLVNELKQELFLSKRENNGETYPYSIFFAATYSSVSNWYMVHVKAA